MAEEMSSLLRELREVKARNERRQKRRNDDRQIHADVRGIFCGSSRAWNAHKRNSGPFSRWV